MDSSMSQGVLRGRPYRGTVILIRRQTALNSVINCVAATDRYVIVALGSLLVVNVHLPSCNNDLERELLNSTLIDISIEMNACCYTYAIFGGDFNCNVQTQSVNANMLNDFLNNLGFSICNKFLTNPNCIDYTFAVEARAAYSLIDHFYVSDMLPSPVLSLNVIHDVVNLSDHLPIKLSMHYKYFNKCIEFQDKPVAEPLNVNKECPPVHRLKFDWRKADTGAYQESVRIGLFQLHKLLSSHDMIELQLLRPDLFTQRGLNNLYRNLVHILTNSAINSVPLREEPKGKKYWWDNSLCESKNESIKAFQAWKDKGRPLFGESFIKKMLLEKNINT